MDRFVGVTDGDWYELLADQPGELFLFNLHSQNNSIVVGGEHRIDIGLLLPRDLHTLFDRGYVTISPDH